MLRIIMSCININDPRYQEILQRVGNPLLAEVEFSKLYNENAQPDSISEDMLKKVFINEYEKNIIDILDQTINELSTDPKKRISEAEGVLMYELLSDDFKNLLDNEGVTKENFDIKFNEQLEKKEKENWFKKILKYILFLSNKPAIEALVNSVQNQVVNTSFSEKGNLIMYGITNAQKTKIPLINSILFRAVMPFSYDVKSITALAIPNLIFGRTYEQYLKIMETSPVFKGKKPISEEQFNKRNDAWRLSNGLPQENGTFRYVGRGVLDKDYNLIEDPNGEDVYAFVNPEFTVKEIEKLSKSRKTTAVDNSNIVMGNYAISYGSDEVGQYFQYNDRWDLDIASSPFIQKVVNKTQKPFIVSGKIYKAMSYTEEGEPFAYYTHDVNDTNIGVYNDMMEYTNGYDDYMDSYEENIDSKREILDIAKNNLPSEEVSLIERQLNGEDRFTDLSNFSVCSR